MKNLWVFIFMTLPILVSTQELGDLRLTSGFNSSEGRLEIYINNSWSRVCYSGFDIYEGDIACRQLHFLYAERVGTSSSLGYGTGTGNPVLSGLDCSTTDTRLIDCTTSSTSCSYYSSDVGLVCTNKTSSLRLISDFGRTSNLSSGRLEILINNQWGTVCSQFFSNVEADVACRQMGHKSANSFTTTSAVGYKVTSRRVWLDQLDCSSLAVNTNNLRLCASVGTGIASCSHDNDIFLSCTSPGFIRLTNSTSKYSTKGQLEMYWNGRWGAICSYPSFTRTAAQVACRQLGFENVTTYYLVGLSSSSTIQATKFVLSGIRCSSLYTGMLLNCSHDVAGLPSSRCSSSSSAVYLSCGTGDNYRSSSKPPSGGSTAGSSAGGSVVGVVILIVLLIAGVYAYYKCYYIRSHFGSSSVCRSSSPSPPRDTTTTVATVSVTTEVVSVSA